MITNAHLIELDPKSKITQIPSKRHTKTRNNKTFELVTNEKKEIVGVDLNVSNGLGSFFKV